MFLDLKSSTQVAEKLGHKKYYSLLNDFFHEISDSVLSTRAEIYRYVGDEVILMWEVEKGLADVNCLNIFFMIKNSLSGALRQLPAENTMLCPLSRRACTSGTVISAEIGDLKKEIAFSGDVLNTTSRIQEQCNVFECELLISGSLMEQLDLTIKFQAEKIDTVRLRGKESSVDIYHVDLA